MLNDTSSRPQRAKVQPRHIPSGPTTAGLFCGILSIGIIVLGLLLPLTHAPGLSSAICFICGTVLALGAGLYWGLSSLLCIPLDAIRTLPGILSEAQTRVMDMETASKQYNRILAKIDSMQSSLDEAQKNFLKIQSDFHEKERSFTDQQGQLEDQRQATKRHEKTVKAWQDVAISFLDAQQNTLSHPQLSEDLYQGVEKSVKDFVQLVQGQGLDVIRPSVGDVMNETLHRHVGEDASEQYKNGEILVCKSWGYRNGGDILKPAEVIVARMSTQKTEEKYPLSVAGMTADDDQSGLPDACS